MHQDWSRKCLADRQGNRKKSWRQGHLSTCLQRTQGNTKAKLRETQSRTCPQGRHDSKSMSMPPACRSTCPWDSLSSTRFRTHERSLSRCLGDNFGKWHWTLLHSRTNMSQPNTRGTTPLMAQPTRTSTCQAGIASSNRYSGHLVLKNICLADTKDKRRYQAPLDRANMYQPGS